MTNVTNSLAPREKQKFSVAVQGDAYKKLINNALGDPGKAQEFTAAITSAVAINPALQECDPSTILSAALLGQGLKLSPSPQLGQYYMVPFNDTKNNRMAATFQLGYKGYIQLARRTGKYKTIVVEAIKEGELISWNPLTEIFEYKLIENDEEREKAKTIGYYAMFLCTDQFQKVMYWSKAKMEAHAIKYSKGYAAKKGYTFWEKNFDAMACKTMIRQLISKWGDMSIDFQRAYESDGSISTDIKHETYEYADNIEVTAQVENVEAAQEEPKDEPKKTGKGKKSDPLAGTPFEETAVPEFVTDVEEGQ
jgi:recombination protein RecT